MKKSTAILLAAVISIIGLNLNGGELTAGKLKLVLRKNNTAPASIVYDGGRPLFTNFFYSWYGRGQWYSDRSAVKNIRFLIKTSDHLKVQYDCADFNVSAEYSLLTNPDALKAEFYLKARRDICLGGIDPPGGFFLPLISLGKHLTHFYQVATDLSLKLMSRKDFPAGLAGYVLGNCIGGNATADGEEGYFTLLDRRFYDGCPPVIGPGGICFSKDVCRLIKQGEVIKGQFYIIPFKGDAAAKAKMAVARFCSPDPAGRWDFFADYPKRVRQPLNSFAIAAENSELTAAAGGTEQVFPQTPLPREIIPCIRLESAQNQSVFSQIVLKTKKELRDIRFTLDFPTLKDCRINRILPAPSDYPATSFAMAGDFPDILSSPDLPVLSPDAGNAAWLLTIFVPEKTRPGIHKGTIAVLSGKKTVCILPAEVKVYDFALPRSSAFRTVFLLWTSKAYRAQFDQWAHLLDQRKLRITTPAEIATPCENDGTLREPERLKNAIRSSLAAGDCCFRLGSVFMWRPMPFKDKTGKEAETFIKNYSRQVYAILKDLNAVRKVWFLMADETHRPKLNKMHVQWCKWVKEAAPELPIFSTQNHPAFEIADHADILCGPLSSVNVLRKKYGSSREYWIYENGFPFSLGQSEIVTRSMPLRSCRNGIAGYHQWSSSFWTAEHGTGKFRPGHFHGTASLYYPPEFGGPERKPVRSMRLINCAQGIIDLDYAELLRSLIVRNPDSAKGREAAKFLQDNLNQLVPDIYTIRGTTRDFEEFRRGTAHRIMELQK